MDGRMGRFGAGPGWHVKIGSERPGRCRVGRSNEGIKGKGKGKGKTGDPNAKRRSAACWRERGHPGCHKRKEKEKKVGYEVSVREWEESQSSHSGARDGRRRLAVSFLSGGLWPCAVHPGASGSLSVPQSPGPRTNRLAQTDPRLKLKLLDPAQFRLQGVQRVPWGITVGGLTTRRSTCDMLERHKARPNWV